MVRRSKGKYYNEFLEIIKKSKKLKFLSLKIKSNETYRQSQIFNVLSSIKNKYLEEFCLSTYPSRFLPSLVFGYLDKCPNLKIIKLDKIKLNDWFLQKFKNSKLNSVKELHLTLYGSPVILSLKSLLEIITEKPNIQHVFLTLRKRNYQVDLVCQGFCWEKLELYQFEKHFVIKRRKKFG